MYLSSGPPAASGGKEASDQQGFGDMDRHSLSSKLSKPNESRLASGALELICKKVGDTLGDNCRFTANYT